MNFFVKLLLILQTEMPEPTAWGWYHILWIGITAGGIALLYLLKRYWGEKQLKWVLAIYGIVSLLTEVAKQISWSVEWDMATQTATWDYQWYSAPFQLCSTPIYLSLICLFLRPGKLRESLLTYLSLVTIIGGFMTLILPDSCLCSDILVNIHTMWLHCGSFVLAIYLLMSGHARLDKTGWIRASVVFFILAGIALAMNIGVYQSGILGDETFNMFYISPYFISVLPVFDVIQQSVPYLVFLALYFIAVLLGSGIVFWLTRLVKYGVKRYEQRKSLVSEKI